MTYARIAAIAVLASTHAVSAQDPISVARTLYASASYEEALATLATVEAGGDPNQADEYRALCYLALGQNGSAEQALERIVRRAPLYALNELDVSPRLVTLFQDVRQRTLPAIARTLYASGKAGFEQGDFTRAAGELRLLIATIDAMSTKGPEIDDMRQVGEGFLKLTEAAIVAATPPPPPPPAAAAAAAAATVPGPAVPELARIYSAVDLDVKPPVGIEQRMPRWSPPTGFLNLTYAGTLEVIVDHAGEVESVDLVQATGTPYDAQVVAAARRWKYEPATRASKPVKYRRTVGFVLRGPSATSAGRD